MGEMRNVDVVVLGYMFNERIRFQTRVIGPVLGGTASYAAVCLGRLGTRTGIVSNIADTTPAFMTDPLREAGVDLTGLNRRAGISTTETILVYDDQGNKEIEYVKRAPLILPGDIPESYYRAEIFLLCEVDFEVPLATVVAIRRKNPLLKIAADLGGIGGAHSTPQMRREYIEAEGGKKFEQYFEYIDFGKASLEDCSKMFGKRFDNAEEPGALLLRRGIGTVLITLGEQGSLILTKDGEHVRVPAIEPEGGVIDATGAGDTFIAAFISEYLASRDNKRAGYFAAAAASLLIEKSGGVSAGRSPERPQVEERLGKFCRSRNLCI